MNNNYLNDLSTLISDACANKVAMFEGEQQAKFTDEAIRQAFFEILGDDKLTYQNWRMHKNEIYTVIENVINTNLPLAWENSPYFDQFVEVKNGALGDKNAFIVEDNSILVASRFSGNHWGTERQKLQGVRETAIPTEWIYIGVYDELEKFLKGNTTVEKMMKSLQKGFNNEIDGRVYSAFVGAGACLPSAFTEGGVYDKDTMMELIMRVQIESQSPVVLAGTKLAMAKITSDPSVLSNRQKEELATNGCLLDLNGLGVQGIEIPQTFTRGTYDFKVNNNTIYVLPANFKPIKLFFEGDTRARELTDKDTDDMTLTTQIQTKLGCSIIFNSLFGKYTLS